MGTMASLGEWDKGAKGPFSFFWNLQEGVRDQTI